MANQLDSLRVVDLLNIARQKELKGYSKLRKADLISLIIASGQHPTPHPQQIDKCYGKICNTFQICNPPSGRCVNKNGDIGKKLIVSDALKTKIYWKIYSIDGCSSCKKAKELFNKLGLEYKEIKVHNKDIKEFFDEKASVTGGYKFFPVIFNNEHFIGGYVELEKLLDKPTSSTASSLHMINPAIVKRTDFQGSPWDDLTSMLYLLHKHKKDCVAIPSALLTGSGRISNKGLAVSSYKDTSLIWDSRTKKFIVPDGLWDAVRSCLKKKATFIVLPLGINTNVADHANFLVYNSLTKSLERFDPCGFPKGDIFNPTKLDEQLGHLFNKNVQPEMVKDVYDPLSFCPLINFQKIQKNEHQNIPGDPEGFCVAWAAWYADIRLSNPNKSRTQVVKMAMETLYKNTKSFSQFIRSYSVFLSTFSKKLAKSNNPADVFASYARKNS